MKKLSWKIALVTGSLVILVILSLSVPIYWQTRQALEKQLSQHMKSNITLFRKKLDFPLIEFLNKYPESLIVKDSLKQFFSRHLLQFSANTIYIVQESGIIILSVGKEESAVKSVMLHKREISQALEGKTVSSPLFSDRSGNHYKSVFCPVSFPDSSTTILAIDANADFFLETAKLRRQIFTIGGIVLLISIVISLILSQTLTHPLYKLTQFASEIGKGRGRSFSLENRNDEIGFLGKTMQKMQSEIDQREKENKQLIASVAHEIRNPLGGMQVNADLLLEESEHSSKTTKYTKAISREVKHLSEIVESFLTYARPIEHNTIFTDIRQILQESVSQIQSEFPNRNISIVGNGKTNIHPGKMRHAFYNLLKNGVEATDNSNIIEVKIINYKTELKIHFCNKGKSIPQEIQPQIFDAFFSTKASGVGLGLTITKSIVEQHGGNIYLVRSDENGTEFVLILPKS